MKRIGIIDIGSNSVHLKIYEINSNNNFTAIYKSKKFIRLGEDLSKNNRLTNKKIDETLEVLKEFKKACISDAANEVIAVATEAVRKADNGMELISLIKDKTDIDIKILSGEEECYYDFFCVKNSMNLKDALLIDIGGCSTELILMKDMKIAEQICLPIGSLNVTEKFSLYNSLQKENEKALKEYLLAYFKRHPWITNTNCSTLVGIGGSMRSIGKIHKTKTTLSKKNIHNHIINIEDLQIIYNDIKAKDFEQRKKIAGMTKGRSDIILGAFASIITLAEFCNIKELRISAFGLREGLLYSNLVV